MDFVDVGLKDSLILGLIMGLLKFASMRIFGYMESDLTWWEAYGIWTVLSLFTIAIHVALRHVFEFRSSRRNTTPSSQEVTQIEDYEAKR